MDRKRRVLFIINSLEGAGAERIMASLLASSEAERDKYDISLVLLDAAKVAHGIPKWVTVYQFNCRRSLIRSVLALRAAFKQNLPDVTVSFLTRSNVANILLSILTKTPCIASERGNTQSRFPKSLTGRITRLIIGTIYRHATHVVAVSRGVAQALVDSYSIRDTDISVIPNPIDIRAIKLLSLEHCPIAPNEPYMIAMGRLVDVKNFDLLIDAFAASGFGGNLVILGEGPRRAALSGRADRLGISNRVYMPGWLENPFTVLRGAHVFVLSSKSGEGYPNALIEAMALGVPVIATDCLSGPSEILADETEPSGSGLRFAAHGILVPPGSVESMAMAIKAMEDPNLRRRYGKLAAKRAAALSNENRISRYWDLIHFHVERGGGP